jgi:hypothetical protein
MSEIASSGPTKRKRRSTTPAQPRKAAKAQGDGVAVAPQQRHAMIAEGAYLRAAERGFRGGDAVADWLASEREVDALLSAGGQPPARQKTRKI